MKEPLETAANGADNEKEMNMPAVLEKWNKSVTFALGFLLVGAIGYVDYLTGYEMAFSAFYLIPISLLAWSNGKWPGLVGSLLSAIVWTLADQEAGHPYSRWLIPYWNAAIRLTIFVFLALILSSLKESIRKEQTLARSDSLTGAANTRSFMELLRAEVDRSRRYGRPFTLAYVDLDNFKTVNDTFGHDKGDQVLRTVVSIMRTHIRSTDVIARLGGDEFALLLPETD